MTSEVVAGTGRGRLLVAGRVVGAVFVGYGFCSAWVALLAVALPRISGMARSEAVVLASMLGFLTYLGVLIWAFAARNVPRVWAVLAGGAVLAYALMRLVKLWS
jgi:hypothetical protein